MGWLPRVFTIFINAREIEVIRVSLCETRKQADRLAIKCEPREQTKSRKQAARLAMGDFPLLIPPVLFPEQIRMRACIDKSQRQHRLLLQIDQEPVALYVAFAERFHAARKLVVVEFFLKGVMSFFSLLTTSSSSEMSSPRRTASL